MNARRSLGFGLALFGLGTAVALTQAGPGGQYKDAVVTTWVGRDHWVTAFVMAYVGVAAALALLVVAHHARTVFGRGGAALERLATVGATLGAAGWMLSGGISVALAEGGPEVQAGLSHPLTYVLSEMANLLGACGPSIVIGVAALILAIRAPMPTWLRVFSVLASVCGITAPLYFTFYVFVLWCLVLAAWLVAPRREARVTEPGPSLVG